MSSMFSAPSTASAGMDFQLLVGRLLLIDVLEKEEHVPTIHTKPGEKSPAIRANVAILDGPEPGKTYEDTLIFPKVLQSQLRSRVGQKVVGRLGQGVAKPGQTAPWQLIEATPADYQVAENYVRASIPPVTGAAPPF